MCICIKVHHTEYNIYKTCQTQLLERHPGVQEQTLLLQRMQVWFFAPTSGDLQVLCGTSMHMYAYTQRHTQIHRTRNSQVWQHMPLILALKRQRQVFYCEFETRHSYKVRFSQINKCKAYLKKFPNPSVHEVGKRS